MNDEAFWGCLKTSVNYIQGLIFVLSRVIRDFWLLNRLAFMEAFMEALWKPLWKLCVEVLSCPEIDLEEETRTEGSHKSARLNNNHI